MNNVLFVIGVIALIILIYLTLSVILRGFKTGYKIITTTIIMCLLAIVLVIVGYGSSVANNIVANTVVNFVKLNKTIESIEEAHKYNIMSEQDRNLFTTFSGSSLDVFLNGNDLKITYKKMPLKLYHCETFLNKMSSVKKSVLVNKVPLEKLLSSPEEMKKECDKNQFIIEATLSKQID